MNEVTPPFHIVKSEEVAHRTELFLEVAVVRYFIEPFCEFLYIPCLESRTRCLPSASRNLRPDCHHQPVGVVVARRDFRELVADHGEVEFGFIRTAEFHTNGTKAFRHILHRSGLGVPGTLSVSRGGHPPRLRRGGVARRARVRGSRSPRRGP